MRIPRHKVDEIFHRADILEVVSDYVQLKKKGHYYVGLSPFKHERTPSFTVTPSKGIFKDFSTGKGGNAVTFLMEIEGYSYTEALLRLAERYQIEIEPDHSPESKSRDAKNESLRILNKFASDYFHKNLFTPQGNSAYRYLSDRGYSDDTIKLFQLGYCLSDWDAFSQTAIQNQFNDEYLIETGLSIRSEKNGKLFDRFHGRVIFPIHDVGGKIVGFSGRLIEKKENTGKYINSPESVLYTKGKILFGLYFAKNSIRETEEAILVEGNADMISLFQAGFKNTVASSGTALTEEQINLLRRFAKRVLLIFDGDTAGISASIRAIDLLLRNGLGVKVLLLPDGHDPDSYLKDFGFNGFQSYVEKNATDAISFKINVLHEKYNPNDPSQRGFLIGEIGQTIAKIPDEIQRSLYVQIASERLQISEQLMLSAMNKSFLENIQQENKDRFFETTRNQALPPDFEDEYTIPQSPKAEKTALANLLLEDSAYSKEREILRLMLNYPDGTLYDWTDDDLPNDDLLMYEYIYQEIGDMPFKHAVFEVIREKLMQAYVNDEPVPIDELLHNYGNEVQSIVTELLTNRYSISDRWSSKDIAIPKMDWDLFESVKNSLLHFKLEKYNDLIRQNAILLKDSQAKTEIGFELIEKLLKRKITLEAKRREITQQLGIVIM